MVFHLHSGEIVTDRNPTHVHVGVTTDLLAEALAQVRVVPDEQRIKQTIDLGRVIGACTRVETRAEDEIVFAQRPDRDGLTRFVKNRQPEPTTLLTISLRRTVQGDYEIRTAYLGEPGHIEPWAAPKERYQDAVAFWSQHALCWGYEPIVPGTGQNDCPW